MSNDLLSVKEVANIIGCSVQAVYNRLEKDFKPYLKIKNNKKLLSRGVLNLIEQPSLSSDFKDILKLLERQLEEKDKHIQQLSKQIDQLNERLKEAHQQTNVSQQLHGAEKMLLLQNKSPWWSKKRK